MASSVAINAQFDPNLGGGVESNIHGLLGHVGGTGVDLVVLTHHDFHSDVEAICRPDTTVLDWTLGQEVVPRPVKGPIRRGRRVRHAMGSLGFVFDAGVYAYRRVRRPAIPSAHTIDRVLHAAGVRAVHFPTQQHFRTTLPYAYEPWDLQHRHLPAFFTPEERCWRDRVYGDGCRGARLVITASRWTKDDIVEQFGISPRKIAVIPRDSAFVTRTVTEARGRELLGAAGIPERFIFYPAMTYEHKNHLRLFEALVQLRDARGLAVPLVLSGRSCERHMPTVETALDTYRLRGQVTQLGVVSQEMLAALFQSARFMVFPSLFEGLGLPVLEAFRHGLPVLAAAETCVPEVAGDAARLFDAWRPESMADAIEDAWRHPERLEPMRPAGRRRLEGFTWDRAGAKFDTCYKVLLGNELSRAERQRFEEMTES